MLPRISNIYGGAGAIVTSAAARFFDRRLKVANHGTRDAAPLEVVAQAFAVPGVSVLVVVGAVTAMLGVLLNLILGLSRVVLAMARRGDLPRRISSVSRSREAPVAAVLVVGGLTCELAIVGDVKATWSFSAFSVLNLLRDHESCRHLLGGR